MNNDIFKSLADPSRRMLLDLLHESDGRTLSDLCTHLDMSRVGVMKHLKILEESNLITTQKVGRERLHFLNAVPLRHVYERWVSKYTEPWTIGLTQLKSDLERSIEMQTKIRTINRIAIKSTPEEIWHALTEPSMTSKYWYNGSIRADWKEGAPYTIYNQQGNVQAKGEILILDPPHKLVMSWKLMSLNETKEEPPSRLTWEINSHHDIKGVTLVTVIHDQYDQSPKTAQTLEHGLPIVLSGMKTLLETGLPLE
ncbi:ArsR/SmtB family transcription factor [Fictibacillus sp. JL2B1089]|uniref:ArsR/SmtB family transcription factor n=1 Tax=Fictibacillus sp. JL2B1089 TaxID=3399565 RepID=UPI003A897FC2